MENQENNPSFPPKVSGPVGFNLASTVQSPFFWLVAGAAAVLLLQHYGKKKESRPPMRNVTGTGE